jgi:molybdopterin-guanine dinucleotide biosynthesis protein A
MDRSPPRPPIAAAILAGGRAQRMAGANKAALRLGNERILDRQIALLRQVADPVFIVSSRADVAAELAGGITVVPDRYPGTGPLGGMYTALACSPHERTLIVACDMPFLTLPLLQMLARESAADAVVPRTRQGYEPLCATYTRACAEPIRRRIERGALKAALVIEEVRVEEIGPEVLAGCDPHGLLFVNVNTPHDYERARDSLRTARQDE